MLLPPPTNDAYRGSPIAIAGLFLLAAVTLVPACIHLFLPDGGAQTIAGLDLSTNRETIIGLFAWAGTTQLVWGLVILIVALRYRSFAPLIFALALFGRSIHALNMWVLKPGSDGHSPPEAYATLALLPVLALLLILSLRQRKA